MHGAGQQGSGAQGIRDQGTDGQGRRRQGTGGHGGRQDDNRGQEIQGQGSRDAGRRAQGRRRQANTGQRTRDQGRGDQGTRQHCSRAQGRGQQGSRGRAVPGDPDSPDQHQSMTTGEYKPDSTGSGSHSDAIYDVGYQPHDRTRGHTPQSSQRDQSYTGDGEEIDMSEFPQSTSGYALPYGHRQRRQ